MKNVGLYLLLVSIAFSSIEAQAQIKHSLGALAVSPDNSMLVAAGYNRVMYVCDPADMSVKQRIYIEIVPSEVYFSDDGKSLVLFSSDRVTMVYDTESWKAKAEIKSTQDISIATESNEMAILHGLTYSDGARYSPVAVYDLTTGEKKREARFEFEGAVIGINNSGSQVVLMSRPKTDESETKEKAPKELKDLERAEFELKHDGRTSEIMWLDDQLKETNRFKNFYSESGSNQLVVNDNAARFVVYRNRCAEFTPDGDVKLFQTSISYNYGVGISANKLTVAAGGMGTGMVMDIEKKTSLSFKHSRLPGFPEYFYGFAFGPDGTVYGGTSAWRIIKVSSEGKVVSETPIY